MFGIMLGRAHAAAPMARSTRLAAADWLTRSGEFPLSWRPDLSRDAMLLLGVVVGLAQASGGFAAPVDAVMYWEAGTSVDLYPMSWATITSGQLPYPPPIAQVSTLLQPIGWPVFILSLTVSTFAAFWFCARRWSLPLIAAGLPWFFGVGPEEPAKLLAYALIGNLQWILAALTIVALRNPALWSLEVVTKVTTAVGWWWHVLRAEWRPAAIGAVSTIIIVGVSFVASPDLWIDYVGFAARNFTAAEAPIPTFPVPFGIRLATSVPLLVWGARTDRPWTVPVVCGWSLVGLYSFGFLPFWVAAYRVWRMTNPPATRDALGVRSP